MFGLVSQRRHDKLRDSLYEIGRLLRESEETKESLFRQLAEHGEYKDELESARDALTGILKLCIEGGVTDEPDPHRAVLALIHRIHEAAATLSEKEKLHHFNRGLRAGREVKHP